MPMGVNEAINLNDPKFARHLQKIVQEVMNKEHEKKTEQRQSLYGKKRPRSVRKAKQKAMFQE